MCDNAIRDYEDKIGLEAIWEKVIRKTLVELYLERYDMM